MTPRRKKSDDPTPPNEETPSSAPSADPTGRTSGEPDSTGEGAATSHDHDELADPTEPDLEDTVVGDDDKPPAEPDLEGAIDRLSQSIEDRVFVMNDDWERLMGLLQTVEETAAEHETCKKAASDAKKDHEAAQAALQRALTRMRDGLKPTDEPTLPFDGVHQSDVVQAAHDDPAVVSLTERLTAIGWDVTPELVAGWTVDERAQLVAWLDALERPDTTEVPPVPPLAVGQPSPYPPAPDPLENPKCAVCGAPDAFLGKPLNGLTADVPACEDCREAVKRREVGVSRNEDGTLSITDGRPKLSEAGYGQLGIRADLEDGPVDQSER